MTPEELRRIIDSLKPPQPQTHTRSSTQTQSIEQMDRGAEQALKRGVQRWIPDAVGFAGDIADGAYYAGRRILNRQGEQSVPNLGAGAALRRYAQERMGIAPERPTQMEMRETPETDWREEAAALANPLFFMNPAKLMQSPVALGVAGAFSGIPMGGLGVIKNKGGNWLSGSVEGALNGLKRNEPIKQSLDLQPELVSAYQQTNPEAFARSQKAAHLNNWIDKQLTRYVKNEMATPEDPIRALAERGVLHFNPQDVALTRRTVHQSGEVFPTLGQSQLAKAWEQTSDNFIAPETAGRFKITRGQDGTTTMSRNPWLEKLPNDAVVHDVYESSRPSQLGFGHLTDELSNAINPESGLPRHLLLDPNSLPRVSVPQAVERVAQINAWRAAQKAEADALRANNAATRVHKEYPEKGMKWVELRKQPLPEGWTQEGTAYVDPANPSKWVYPEESLQDALRYEGDAMGHCVGGYCDDVASGRSKIYSLRDAKGQPHVTVEVTPKDISREMIDRDWLTRNLGEEQSAQIMQDFMKSPHNNISKYLESKSDLFPPSITQIKGKSNKAPNDEYLPFVQDFVKSGKWSDVGDLQNTGLRRTTDAFNEAELAKIRAAGIEPSAYHSPDEISNMRTQVWGEDILKKARGGPVNKNNLSVEQLRAIIGQLRMEHSNA